MKYLRANVILETTKRETKMLGESCLQTYIQKVISWHTQKPIQTSPGDHKNILQYVYILVKSNKILFNLNLQYPFNLSSTAKHDMVQN